MRNKEEKQSNHFEDFEAFSLVASIFKYSSTWLVLSFLLYKRFYFEMVLYKV